MRAIEHLSGRRITEHRGREDCRGRCLPHSEELAGRLGAQRMERCHLSAARPPGLGCGQGPFCRCSRCHRAARSRAATHLLLRSPLTARSGLAPCAQGHKGANERSQQEHRGHRVTGKAGHSEQQSRKHGHRYERTITRLWAAVRRGIGLCRCGPERRRCWRQPGGDVAGNRRQFRISARSERLADPRVELLFGHQAIHVRGFERVDDPVAVGVGCAQAPTVVPCHLASWPGHLSCLPRSQRARAPRAPSYLIVGAAPSRRQSAVTEHADKSPSRSAPGSPGIDQGVTDGYCRPAVGTLLASGR
jgi:hypothetical protein